MYDSLFSLQEPLWYVFTIQKPDMAINNHSKTIFVSLIKFKPDCNP